MSSRTPLPGRPVSGRSDLNAVDERNQSAAMAAATFVVATIVVGQLWALTVALEAWLNHHTDTVKWILGFQFASFAVALGIWFATPKGR